MSSNDDVYRGWTNWSYGPAFGKTITLTSPNGLYLISFLTLYVTFTGTRFWVIIAFFVHQEMAKWKDTDRVCIQQQMVLCNSSTSMSAAFSFALMVYAEVKKWKKPPPRSLQLIAIGLFTAGAFTAASLFASRVVKSSSNETLIASSNCNS